MALERTLVWSVSSYVILMSLTWVLKPRFLFHEDGTARRFGCGADETVFALPFVMAVFAILAVFGPLLALTSRPRLNAILVPT